MLIYTISGGDTADTWATTNNKPAANHDNSSTCLERYHHTLSLKYNMKQILKDDPTINKNELMSSTRVITSVLDTASTSSTAIATVSTADGMHHVSIVFYLKLMIRRDDARSGRKIKGRIYLARCDIDECDGCVRMDVLLWLSRYSSSAIMMNDS